MKAFDKVEWKRYDIEHFGREIDWVTNVYYLIATEGKDIVGTMELIIEAGIGTIKTLIISYTWQRKGVGRMMIKKAEEITKMHGGHKLFLVTGKSWKSVKFYEAHGFTKTGDLPNHFFKVDFIEMSKSLDEG